MKPSQRSGNLGVDAARLRRAASTDPEVQRALLTIKRRVSDIKQSNDRPQADTLESPGQPSHRHSGFLVRDPTLRSAYDLARESNYQEMCREGTQVSEGFVATARRRSAMAAPPPGSARLGLDSARSTSSDVL